MEARIEARKILGKASIKEDVAEARSALRKQITVAELADRYLDEHVAHQNKPSTQAEVRRIVKHRIKPKLGKLKIQALTRARIKEWHHGMRATPFEANRVLAYLSKMMSLAGARLGLASRQSMQWAEAIPGEQARTIPVGGRTFDSRQGIETGRAGWKCAKNLCVSTPPAVDHRLSNERNP